ncbi:MAG: branched-chain amino acid ABC transporter permease [Theionarchaea archaeon]|nr:branched-chain amino acid ABC transporter permease [Theionarchaea archaeon]
MISMFSSLLQVIVGGLAQGAIYAIAALGFVLLYTASGTVNFAQGEMIMLPVFFIYVFYIVWGMPLVLAIILTIALSALLGLLVEKGIIQHLLGKPFLTIIIVTFALSEFMKYSVAIVATAYARAFPSFFNPAPINVGGIILSQEDVGTILSVALVIFILYLFMKYAKTGKAMRAVAQDRKVAKIVGINVLWIISLVFIINGVLVAIGGILIAPIYFVRYDIGVMIALKAFIAAIMGGFNKIQGPLAGGLFLGVSEGLVSTYVSSAYRDIFVFMILIVILLIKPEGFFGIKEEEYTV